VLALAAITVTAGAAFADELPGFSDRGQHGWHGKDTDVDANGGNTAHGSGGGDAGDVPGEVDGAGAGSGSGSGQNAGSGGDASGGVVTGSGAGTPSAPVEAPAVAPSGPAPDGATAAPTSGPPPSGVTADAFVAAGDTTDAPGVVVPAPDGASVTEPALQQPALQQSELAGLAQLPVLGSIGQVADQVTDGPSAARALLSTGTGRSLAVLLSLLVAISVFLAVHRRADRGDRKLAAARTGPEVARFR